MIAQCLWSCFQEFLEDNFASILFTTANFTLYYISSKVQQSYQNELNHFQLAPLIRDFSQLKKSKSGFPYAVVEGQVYPNNESITSHYNDQTEGVVQELRVWQLKKAWNVITQTWEMSKDLFGSYERHVPMNLADKKNTRIFIDNFSECHQRQLLEEVSNVSEANDDHILKKILANLLQKEVVTGYKRVEKMLRVGQTVIFCGKVVRDFESGSIRLSKPDSPLTFECTALSYDSLLNLKISDVKVIRIVTLILSAGLSFMAIYLSINYLTILKGKFREHWERRILEDLVLETEEPRGLDVGIDSHIVPNTQVLSVCSVCYERPINIMVRTCNHACLCATCALKVRTCPICRAPVQKFERIYLP